MSGAHGHVESSNKKVAMLIAVLALVLALSETLGKSAQTAGVSANIEASNLWAFYQAKTVRRTIVRTAAQQAEAQLPFLEPKAREALEKRVKGWREDSERYDTEPETQEGRKELAARAKEAEKKRDYSLAAYHHFEIASAAVQIAIVLASAEVITGVVALVWLSGALGIAGIAFCAIALFWPTAVHLF
jgi:hypothetical protein